MSRIIACALFALLSVYIVAAATDMDSLIREVNNKQSAWVAGHNFLTQKPIHEVRKMLGLNDVRPSNEQFRLAESIFERPKYTTKNLPENFDGRTQWPGCIHPIRDQAHCGSCWAFSATEMLSDRFCIASNKTINVVLSPQDAVSCSSLNFGCDGGILGLVQAYMWISGVVTDKCFPYTAGDGHVEACPSTCKDGSGKEFSSQKYYAKSIYPLWIDIPSHRVEKMKADLVQYGPQQTGFMVYEDFLSYKSGVYRYTSGQFLGGHAVKIVGYGKDEHSGDQYWLVANSWSEQWGEKGYFRIRLGTDECGFEGSAWGSIPNTDKVPH